MKTISGKQAYEILCNSSAIIIDDNALLYPSVEEESDGEYFLYLSYLDDEGLEYAYTFLWYEDTEIEIKDNEILLKEKEGDYSRITVLEVKML